MHVPSSTEYINKTDDIRRSPTIVLNGCRFCFSQSTVTTSRKVPLLRTTRGDFNTFLPLANEGKLRILSYDQRGHGQSEVVGPFTFDQLVQDVEAFCKVFVEGKTPSSCLEDPLADSLLSRLYKVPSASPGMLDKIFSPVDNDIEFHLIVFALAPLYVETYDADAGLNHVEGIYRAKVHNDLYSEHEKYFDYTERLPNLKVKTLILVGEFDWICPPRQAKRIHELVSTSKLFVVKGANHSCHLEKTSLILGKLKLFLEDILQPLD
ncbi:alpha/beta-hydrolase, partial [Atractiella rhizophila]